MAEQEESDHTQQQQYTYTLKFKSLDFASLTSIPEAVSVSLITASGDPFATKQYWPSLFMNNKVTFQNESFTHSDDSLACELELFTASAADSPMRSIEKVPVELASGEETKVSFEQAQVTVILEVWVKAKERVQPSQPQQETKVTLYERRRDQPSLKNRGKSENKKRVQFIDVTEEIKQE